MEPVQLHIRKLIKSRKINFLLFSYYDIIKLEMSDNMNQIKIDRISSNLVKEISYILMTEVKNPDVKFVTVTDCKVTNDLSYAKVYVTVLNKDKIQETLEGLKDASGFIRHNLKERVDIRNIPELEFVYDESIEYGQKIEDIIEQIHEEDND